MPLSHPRNDLGTAGAIINWPGEPCGSRRSRFLLKERGCNSSSWLWVLSLLEDKDGTRTIEMILVSTVLTRQSSELQPLYSTIKSSMWDQIIQRMRK